MDVERLCPRCGAKSSEKNFIGSFCQDCYQVKLELPEKIVLAVCRDCGKMRGKGWEEASDAAVERAVLAQAKGKYENARLNRRKAEVVFLVSAEGTFLEVRKPVEVEFKKILCPDCGKAHGGYCEAIVQLRGNPGKIAKYAEKMKRMLEEHTFITKTEERHGGVDFMVGDKRRVRKVLGDLHLDFIHTTTLMGEKEGRRIYRSTYSVRFP